MSEQFPALSAHLDETSKLPAHDFAYPPRLHPVGVAGPKPGATPKWGTESQIANIRRWRPKGLQAGRVHTEILLQSARLRAGHLVLDVACGAGEPALEEARRVGPDGRVTGVDPSDSIVDLAREFAQHEGLTRIDFKVGTAENLPVPDHSYDRVTSRFGPMYFSDLPRALSECRRVLRPAGRVAWLVWGPIDQPFFESTVLVALRHAGLAELPPDAAQPFRFGAGGILSGALKAAGFDGVEETQHEVLWSWPGTPREVCEVWISGAPPFRTILESLGDSARDQAVVEMMERFGRFYKNGRVEVPEKTIVVSGTSN